jgi:hypothetical protein
VRETLGEIEDEGAQFGQENLREVQDHPSSRADSGYMRKPEAQTAPRMIMSRLMIAKYGMKSLAGSETNSSTFLSYGEYELWHA